ncbi:uncharacterized protein CCOS01_17018 [Colletotrichum costaricense]|nr:uncharacterized protein CCOS01_17018 [Colletotrichum costaricense]XP_060381477.1 uncharacterized protein CTAM01_07709 [Colletotrichum tamarilloi]KAK1497439.1 hypothetical protein CTAM01_07709 [Colletotrichum tamarilloi]KAK1503842.1 hypothetical protein CCOS01_17018 [Colletotrichum costaricense]
MFCSCAWLSKARKLFDIVLYQRRTKKSNAKPVIKTQRVPLAELIITAYSVHNCMPVLKAPDPRNYQMPALICLMLVSAAVPA